MRAVILITAIAISACAGRTELTPAAAGPLTEDTARASDANVTVAVETDAWEGRPATLTEVIPLQVAITNQSDQPLLVRYRAFALVTDQQRQPALPPFAIEETETVPVNGIEPIDPYGYPYDGFAVAPYLSPFYPGLTPYADPFAYDAGYYSTYYPTFARLPLPTADMVRKALPEGVLEPGGRITGFLYFDGLDDPERVRLVAELVNARTNEQFGTITIPFLTEG